MPIAADIRSFLEPSASAILWLSMAIVLGLGLGRVPFKGVRLGTSGVIFSALALAQVGVTIPQEALTVLRDLSLVLLVYAIGLQVGPGFVASFRSGGVRLNALAAAVLLSGSLLAAFLPVVRGHSATGVFAGSFTSTPALASAQMVIRRQLASDPGAEAKALASAGLAYAITYPVGIVVPILLIGLLRHVFRIRLDEERAALVQSQTPKSPPTATVDIEVTRAQYAHAPISSLPAHVRQGVVISRIFHDGFASVPHSKTVLETGDVVRAVGRPEQIQELVAELGRVSTTDLSQVPGTLRRAELIVTRAGALRRPLRELNFRSRTGVTIVQVTRAGIDLVPHAEFALKFGDRVTVVGSEAGIRTVGEILGNEPDVLNRTYLLPVFLGITLAVIVGAIPIQVPGSPTALHLGMAGGALLVAILLSRLERLGPLVWHMPATVNSALRDMGMCIFLACVGFQAGPGLIERTAQEGPAVIAASLAVVALPLLVVACFARRVLRMNFFILSGWIAGTMTNTPALEIASDDAKSDAPALAYASVAPLCELLPILCAELIALGVSGAGHSSGV